MVPCFRTIRHDTAEQYLHNTADEEKTAWHNYDKPRPFWYDDARTWGRTCIVVRGSKAAHFFWEIREILGKSRQLGLFCSFAASKSNSCCRRLFVLTNAVDVFWLSVQNVLIFFHITLDVQDEQELRIFRWRTNPLRIILAFYSEWWMWWFIAIKVCRTMPI